MSAKQAKATAAKGPCPVEGENDPPIFWPIDKVDACPWNKRKIRVSAAKNKAMEADLKDNGQEQNCTTRPHPDAKKRAGGWVQMCAGSRRLTLGKRAGLSMLLIRNRDLDDRQARAVTARENAMRDDLEPWEEAETVAELLAAFDGDHEAVAKEMRQTKDWVARRAQLTTLGKKWMNAWQADPEEAAAAEQALESEMAEGEDESLIPYADLDDSELTEEQAAEREAYYEAQQQEDSAARFDANTAKVISRFTIGHMELIARLPEDTRDTLWDQIGSGRTWWGDSIKAFDNWINQNLMRLVANAPWDITDDALVPKAGACTECPHRSSCQGLLFADLNAGGKPEADDRCLNVRCWQEKLDAHTVNTRKELEAEHPGLVIITGDWEKRQENPQQYRTITDVVLLDKANGGIPALAVDGREQGQVLYIDPKRSRSSRARTANGDGGTTTTSGPTTLAERRDKLDRRRKAQRVKLLVAHICGERDDTGNVLAQPMDTPSADDVVCMAAAFGLDFQHTWLDQTSWPAFTKLAEEGDQGIANHLWKSVREVIKKRLNYSPSTRIADLDDDAARFAELLGFDWEGAWTTVCADLTEPKGWANLNEDGTKKEKEPKADAASPEGSSADAGTNGSAHKNGKSEGVTGKPGQPGSGKKGGKRGKGPRAPEPQANEETADAEAEAVAGETD